MKKKLLRFFTALLACSALAIGFVACKEEHTHDYAKSITPPTCTELGFTTYTCECGDSYVGAYVNALDHTLVIDEAVAPTCTETGLTAGCYCSVCSKILVAQKTVSAKGHFYTQTVVPPTKTGEGYTVYECECGDTYKDDFIPAGSLGLAYSINPDGITCKITGIGDCKDTDVIIPESINGYTVISIENEAFKGLESLTSITIPDNVTSIGRYAFRDCTGLTSITIPNTITSIGYETFYNTAYYNNIENWENDVLYIEKYLICAKTTLFGHYTIKEGTLGIFDSAFMNCGGLTEISIPDSVTFIGNSAFGGCVNLTSITIPYGVISIGDWAFCYCRGLKNITISDSVTSIGGWAFYDCSKLTKITIGNSVTSIGNFAFVDCTSLISITIPDSITSIEDRAFKDCASLTNIEVSENNTTYKSIEGNLYSKNGTLLIQYAIGKESSSFTVPDSVTEIGNYAFDGCIGLTSIIIPDSVIEIDDYAFENFTSLTNIEVSENNTTYKSIDGNLYSKNGTCLIQYATGKEISSFTIPNGVTEIDDYAFRNCTGLTSITIPDSVTSIGDYSFRDCTGLISITIPDSVTSIGNYAFDRCISLINITIPDSVTSIGDDAFNRCTSLTSITIPNSVTSIDYHTFDGCSSLTNITIPNSVTKIDNSAFRDCTSLISITIPDSVTFIGRNVFYGCTGLKNIYYKDTAEEWNKIDINSDNADLTSATLYYYSESKPALNADGTAYDGNYWRYVDGIATPWVYKKD